MYQTFQDVQTAHCSTCYFDIRTSSGSDCSNKASVAGFSWRFPSFLDNVADIRLGDQFPMAFIIMDRKLISFDGRIGFATLQTFSGEFIEGDLNLRIRKPHNLIEILFEIELKTVFLLRRGN
ncbi:hypothetical protein V6N13_028313 [Hibiscus sabdariffa]